MNCFTGRSCARSRRPVWTACNHRWSCATGSWKKTANAGGNIWF